MKPSKMPRSEVENESSIPEHLLIGAVMLRAACDAIGQISDQTYGRKDYRKAQFKDAQRSARVWFGLNSGKPNLKPSKEGLSFVACCEALNLCPIAVFKRLQTEIEQLEPKEKYLLASKRRGTTQAIDRLKDIISGALG